MRVELKRVRGGGAHGEGLRRRGFECDRYLRRRLRVEGEPGSGDPSRSDHCTLLPVGESKAASRSTGAGAPDTRPSAPPTALLRTASTAPATAAVAEVVKLLRKAAALAAASSNPLLPVAEASADGDVAGCCEGAGDADAAHLTSSDAPEEAE